MVEKDEQGSVGTRRAKSWLWYLLAGFPPISPRSTKSKGGSEMTFKPTNWIPFMRLKSLLKRLRKQAPSVPSFEGSDSEILEQYLAYCSWPAIYYNRIQTVFDIHRPNSVVEIGVAYGYHAQFILKNNPNLTYYGVDPFRAGYDKADSFSRDVAALFSTTEQNGMDRLFNAVSKRLASEFSNRSFLLRSPSVEASNDFDNESLDVVFVDGDHRYLQVISDLESWWPKLRHGGLLIGDDYLWPDVSKAAVEFSDKVGLELVLLSSPGESHQSFLLRKPVQV